jgi:hypothetical protein
VPQHVSSTHQRWLFSQQGHFPWWGHMRHRLSINCMHVRNQNELLARQQPAFAGSPLAHVASSARAPMFMD